MIGIRPGSSTRAGMRRSGAVAALVLAQGCSPGLRAGHASPEEAAPLVMVACDQTSLLAEVAAANTAGGGTILFSCQNTTIPMNAGLGDVLNNVRIDGESKNITLEYTADFTGCAQGDNGIGGPPIARMAGRNSTIRGLSFKNWMESIQFVGTGNTVEDATFLAHPCSDDGVSYIDVGALDNEVRNSRFESYLDKAIQMSSGGGAISGNSFVDCMQPVRGPDYGSGEFFVTDNEIVTSGNRDDCAAVTIDGAHVVHFERNTLQCKRGLRLAGTVQATVRDNFIEGNDRVGVRIGGSAVASLSGNVVRDNGFAGGSLPSGGVVVWENGQADLGGGSLVIGGQAVGSPGGNALQGNGVADARNLRAGYRLEAENNCWDGQEASAIQDDVEGDVDFEPFHHVGLSEICDGLDNDCDGVADEFATTCGVGECAAAGFCSAGADSCVPGAPSVELCDGLDNDCDGVEDEDCVPDLVCAPGDLDEDGTVDGVDLALLAASFGAAIGEAAYVPGTDLTVDGRIDGLDLTILSTDFGTDPGCVVPPAPEHVPARSR